MAPVDEQEQQQAAADLARELASLTCSGVEVVNRAELGGGCVEARRHFRAGERVFLERALVVAKGHTNLARLRAYCGLQPEVQAELRETFWAEEPGIRCAATAACRPDSAGSGDSSAEVLAQLRTEGYEKLTLEEVETVIRVWNLNAYDCALASLACKVSHSCDPNVVMRVDADAGVIEATACRPIKEGEQIGTWYFQDTGLWWMGADIRSSIFKSDRGFRCGCQRCQGTDVCRALPCESCNKGTCVPEGVPEAGKEACNWYCSDCGRRGAGNALRLKAEAELAPRVLMELRPPRNMPKSSPEDLVALDRDATARLGSGHWVAAAAALVLHFRARSGGNLDAFTVACGCRFLGWLMSRSLPLPPASWCERPSPWPSTARPGLDRCPRQTMRRRQASPAGATAAAWPRGSCRSTCCPFSTPRDRRSQRWRTRATGWRPCAGGGPTSADAAGARAATERSSRLERALAKLAARGQASTSR
eukprot:TRINITY_DN23054_c1_g1_i2.p1 TRINITY_DN23054_c1_g1~~TRINITY_DN23054_c1_g1_i2.p1  ORF type:complete len:478 (-),score=82.51 TRINITY_DN23054_c1_g1_i2:448-1881(-)